ASLGEKPDQRTDQRDARAHDRIRGRVHGARPAEVVADRTQEDGEQVAADAHADLADEASDDHEPVARRRPPARGHGMPMSSRSARKSSVQAPRASRTTSGASVVVRAGALTSASAPP